jgi:hypothetical protein
MPITTNDVNYNPVYDSVLNTTLCDKICQWLSTGWWFSPVSSTNEIDRHDIPEILLKVALNTMPKPQQYLEKIQKFQKMVILTYFSSAFIALEK